jgi:deoxyribodipyrimidine photo-lyase
MQAARDAREKIWAVRRGDDFRKEAKNIQDKHGSRKSGIPNRGQRAKHSNPAQMNLPLGE